MDRAISRSLLDHRYLLSLAKLHTAFIMSSPACKAIDGAMKKAGIDYAQLSQRCGIDEARVTSSTFALYQVFSV